MHTMAIVDYTQMSSAWLDVAASKAFRQLKGPQLVPPAGLMALLLVLALMLMGCKLHSCHVAAQKAMRRVRP